MKRSLRSLLAALSLIAASSPGTAWGADDRLAGQDLVALVAGRSWAISPYGNPDNPAVTMVWDFRKDGSVCARGGGSKTGDKCYDQGRWNIKGDLLCWELTWFGESYGLKSKCSTVWKVGSDRLALRDETKPDLSGLAVKPL